VAITKTLKSTSVLRYKNYTYTWVGTDKEDSADKLKYRYRVYDGKFWNSWSAWSSNKVLSTSYKQEIQVNIQVKDSQGQIGESTNKVSLLDKATGVIASSSARAWQSLSWSNIKHFFAKDNKTDTQKRNDQRKADIHAKLKTFLKFLFKNQRSARFRRLDSDQRQRRIKR